MSENIKNTQVNATDADLDIEIELETAETSFTFTEPRFSPLEGQGDDVQG